MTTHYFHDRNEPAVYEIVTMISPAYTTHKPPRWDGCRISGEIAVTKPSWWQVADRFTNTERSHRAESYGARDTEEKAENFFLTLHCKMGHCLKIDHVMYNSLVIQYNAQAQANKPAGA